MSIFGLISRAEHERILAEGRDAAQQVIAKANGERDAARNQAIMIRALSDARANAIIALQRERDDLADRLAPFIAVRERDAKGLFVSAKKVGS